MTMEKNDCESVPQFDGDEESPTNSFFSSTNKCCYHFPCFGSRQVAPPSASRDRIIAGESERRWWTTPFKALRKIREWSEIVAGPKWKTFIRRFNRSKGGAGGGNKLGNFHYDPLSYALNFDEGAVQADEDRGYYPDFVSRYVSCPLSSKNSTDLVSVVAAAG